MEAIAQVCGIDAQGKWSIENVVGDLNLIHYSPSATLCKELRHRGTIVDLKEKVIVARSPGFTPIIVADDLQSGLKTYKDTSGNEHSLNVDNLQFRLGREGVVIKVFKHNGKVYLSSHKKIDVSSSRLGQSSTFEQMYKALGGPTDDLFDKDKLYSPFCHTFIVSHRDLLIGSRVNMINVEGYLYYLGCEKLWEKTSWVSVETEPKQPKDILESDWVPLGIVNHHLKYGFHPSESSYDVIDPRLLSGEFVVGYDATNDQWYRFESTSYNWRLTIREKDVNPRHGFYKHLTLAMKAKKGGAKSNELQQYNTLFPSIPFVDPSSIETSVRSKGYIVSWPRLKDAANKHFVFNTWACYLLACPLHIQCEAAKYYNDYYETCRLCSSKILSIWKGTTKYDKSKAVTNLDNIAVSRIDDIIKQSQKRADPLTSLVTPEIVKQNCENLIKKERGGSLYAINEFLCKYT